MPITIASTPAKLKNILFMTDFSEPSMVAAPYVAGLARKLAASVYLGHIVTPSTLAGCAPEAAPMLYEDLKKQSITEITALAHSAAFAGLKPTWLVKSGTLEDGLGQLAEEHDIHLVVAGTHGRTGMRRFVLGSAVEEICRVATCPVLTVGPGMRSGQEIRFNRILFPTDLSEDSKRVLPALRRVAEEFNAELTVLHVMPKELVFNPEANKLAEPIRTDMMATFKDELAAVRTDYLIGFGDTVDVVLNTARARNVDLIAMGIHNAFLAGVQLKSSTAYRIMVGASCPVLTSR